MKKKLDKEFKNKLRKRLNWRKRRRKMLSSTRKLSLKPLRKPS
jgi:hypothetical protein